MASLAVITDGNFDKEVQGEGPVLVSVSTTWCGPCKALKPIMEELAGEYSGKVKIGKLDADENPNIPARYNVLSVPTLLFFKGGKLIDTKVGLIPKQELKGALEELL